MNKELDFEISKTDFEKAKPTEVFLNLPLHQKVLHIGGHLGLESKFYKDVVFVEPIPKYANFLKKQGFKVIKGAVCGEELYLTTYDQASSVLKPIEHKVLKKIKVKNYSLDDINDGSFDLLVMDVQGSEMNILKSGKLNFEYIILEASKIPRYESAAAKEEIKNYLFVNNFKKLKEFKHGKHDIYDIIFQRIQK
jgi:hypothetical protein